MDMKKFEALLPLLVAALVDKIMAADGISEDAAIEKLYVSELYAALETEETKLWHYSIPLLFALYTAEVSTGKLELPEY
jgi:hypothetical protein